MFERLAAVWLLALSLRFLAVIILGARQVGKTTLTRAQVLFPQIAKIVERYLRECVKPLAPANIYDAFLSPQLTVGSSSGWSQRFGPTMRAEKMPNYLPTKEIAAQAVSGRWIFWTSKNVVQVKKSHLNFLVAD